VLVCLSAASSSARTIARNRVFAVNVLSADQEWLSRRFASPNRPRGSAAFGDVPHRPGSMGAPRLDGAVCWLDCRLTATQTAGDHIIVIGEVLGVESDPTREPLVFHAGRYRVVRDRDFRALSAGPLPPSHFTRKEGDIMKKFSVRKLETMKTTAALYSAAASFLPNCGVVA
jgi:flavin reductase (DIM6/NTAB) family NADH-FMN oxidoreductase RutF